MVYDSGSAGYCQIICCQIAFRLGSRPLRVYPSLRGLYVIPEREFEPHVAAGRIIERQHIDPPREDARVVKGQQIGMRRVLYALPGERWRVDAYLLLWKTAEKLGGFFWDLACQSGLPCA